MRKSIASISKSNYQITFLPPAVHSGWLENRVLWYTSLACKAGWRQHMHEVHCVHMS